MSTERLMMAATFFCVFSAYLFLRNGPAVNGLQLAFRVGLLVAGVGLVIAVLIRTASGKHR